MSIYWFILFLFLIFVELSTVNLVSIWFAIGAIAAMITAMITEEIWIQTAVFAVVSLVSLLITKPLMKKFKKVTVIPTNSDRVIGKKAEVIQEITPDSYGEVKVLGTVWTAASDETIHKGEKVIVQKIDCVKLIVFKEEEK